jgi:uncharacterized protein (TIGR02646 family)
VIYVEKPRRQAPKAFLSAAQDELATVLALYRRAQRVRRTFEFRAYKHSALRDVLHQLFRGKCAYCEAPYSVTGSLEVEHYRPKSVYYWLAADWSNLLPSCNHCNNRKRSKFPLRDPRRQAKKPGQEKREHALLLHPSDPRRSRRPDRHLRFDSKDGSIQAVALGRSASPLGEASIEVYQLAHASLSSARRDWAIRLRWHISNCQRVATSSAAEQQFAYEGLKSFLGPEQPFRALTLQILRESGFKTPSGATRRSRGPKAP